MSLLEKLYRPSLALSTDLYELTMAYAAWNAGLAEREAVFHLAFRSLPFEGGYAVACGLEQVLELLDGWRLDEDDRSYLVSLKGADGAPLFDPGFVTWLAETPLDVSVDAVPEGTVVFPHEPLMRVQGPIVPCMLLETPLLTSINFQTLIATKAARIADAANGDPVIEFGLRRAQGFDGGLSAARAAYVGGCTATSNVLAGRLLGIPVRGTHAHSWVSFFEGELESFETYARALPNNCVFLVDTYDTEEGVRNAIRVALRLREDGHELLGVRLDSGDLAYLSQVARALLDEAGFPEARIVASNELDEHLVTSLKRQGAAISVWGVGTRLVTGAPSGALGGVYKLSSVRDPGGEWQPRVKLSEQRAKTSLPGRLQVRRYEDAGLFRGDLIYDLDDGLDGASDGAPEQEVLVDPNDSDRRSRPPADAAGSELLVPVFRGGERLLEARPLVDVRARTLAQLERLHPTIRRLENPHQYPVGLTPRLADRRSEMIRGLRSAVGRGA